MSEIGPRLPDEGTQPHSLAGELKVKTAPSTDTARITEAVWSRVQKGESFDTAKKSTITQLRSNKWAFLQQLRGVYNKTGYNLGNLFGIADWVKLMWKTWKVESKCTSLITEVNKLKDDGKQNIRTLSPSQPGIQTAAPNPLIKHGLLTPAQDRELEPVEDTSSQLGDDNDDALRDGEVNAGDSYNPQRKDTYDDGLSPQERVEPDEEGRDL